MIATKMPETIVAWPWNSLKAGQWCAHTKTATYDATYTRTDLVEAERAELNELRAYAKEATSMITALTVGGSEFFGKRIGNIYTADLRRCKQNIQALHGHTHDQLVSTRRAMKAERAECVEVLRKAEAALADLGACDDPECGCLRAIPEVTALLAKLEAKS